MKNRFWFCTVLVFALLAVAISAETLQAVVRLPDNNPAPFATVTVGDKVFEADAEGRVTLEVPADVKTVKITWLELTAELPVSANLKFKNRLLYGPPYIKEDFVVTGPDVWEFTDDQISAPLGSETMLFYEDAFDNMVLRAKYSITNPEEEQWYYLRFFIRLYDPGFWGYSVNMSVVNDPYFVRYDGNWDQYVAANMTFFGPKPAEGKEYELVMFAKDETITVYHRDVAGKYTKVHQFVDNSPEAYFDGGFAIMKSYSGATIRELGIFAY
jgi:hypothetical protein